MVTWNELFAFSAVIIGVVTLVVTHYEEEVTALPSQSKRLLNFLFFEDYRHRSPFHPYCSLPRKKSQHRHWSRLA